MFANVAVRMVTDELELNYRMSRNLRTARLTAGLSQEELGQMMGHRRNEISQYETGRRKITHGVLVRAGHALDIDPAWFVTDHSRP